MLTRALGQRVRISLYYLLLIYLFCIFSNFFLFFLCKFALSILLMKFYLLKQMMLNEIVTGVYFQDLLVVWSRLEGICIYYWKCVYMLIKKLKLLFFINIYDCQPLTLFFVSWCFLMMLKFRILNCWVVRGIGLVLESRWVCEYKILS